MSEKQRFNLLNECREKLSQLLYSHVDSLVKSFTQLNLLSESEVAIIRKPGQQKSEVDNFLEIIIGKVKEDDGDNCFDKLIAFMRDLQDSDLLDLANKMTNDQDVDYVPYGQPVQTESSSPPVECEKRKLTI